MTDAEKASQVLSRKLQGALFRVAHAEAQRDALQAELSALRARAPGVTEKMVVAAVDAYGDALFENGDLEYDAMRAALTAALALAAPAQTYAVEQPGAPVAIWENRPDEAHACPAPAPEPREWCVMQRPDQTVYAQTIRDMMGRPQLRRATDRDLLPRNRRRCDCVLANERAGPNFR